MGGPIPQRFPSAGIGNLPGCMAQAVALPYTAPTYPLFSHRPVGRRSGMSSLFDAIGRLPAPDDNVAIATQRLEAGQVIEGLGPPFALSHVILEGHRFVARPIAAGAALCSWGLPFGLATRPLHPGEYVCNASMLEALRERRVTFPLPEAPNFVDHLLPYQLTEAAFQPGAQVAPHPTPGVFQGFPRGGGRGVGTRNFIVVLGVTSQAASYARLLAERLQPHVTGQPQLDGIVAVAHTEGSGHDPLNNRDLLLRTLAGFVVHPNVGAVLIAGHAHEPVTPEHLLAYLAAHHYPLADVRHAVQLLTGELEADLAAGAGWVLGWLPAVAAEPRRTVPLAGLKLALQCGGSDAFSGVSANPLIAAVALELLRHGGAANLAETLELVGAEPYVLANVRDLPTARRFLGFVARFKALVARHGASPEGNPSGGNRYRGLYNIALKSLGAAQKRHPQARLDYAIEYAEPMTAPGYYFMDSPGNDLEGIAGQVASGANLILFTTGNGSITNFPFVPTLKFVTTTGRYELLRQEMDFNAGAYLDGTPLAALAAQAFDQTVAVASGARTAGERAGHSQVSIWRNWRQAAPAAAPPARLAPTGQPLPLRPLAALPAFQFDALRVGERWVSDQVGLILPASLCAGQIARLAAEGLTRRGLTRPGHLSRYVALAHTEGCGAAGPTAHAVLTATLLSYARHPLVGSGLVLEHGCEITHNDHLRAHLGEAAVGRLGWASIQQDGGLALVGRRIEAWFTAALAAPPAASGPAGLESLRLGLMCEAAPPAPLAEALAHLARAIAQAGGLVVVPETSPLLATPAFRAAGVPEHPSATVAYGEGASAGFHIMEAPSVHWVEALTGLGAAGVELILAVVDGAPRQAHPLVPVLQVTTDPALAQTVDLALEGPPAAWGEAVLALIRQTASRRYLPSALRRGEFDFQMTRGLLGVSV